MTSDEFARRVEALRPTLYRVCRSQLRSAADREDAVQEAVFSAWRKRETLRDAQRFDAWFIRILINECHNLQRRRKHCVLMSDPPEPPTQGDHRLKDLREALDALEEKQRLCVLLHHIEGYSVKEVSRMLGVGESTVKLRLMRGRKRLKEMLSEEVFTDD